MPIKEPKPAVKGTTRISFNDRQLARQLYNADKHTRQADQRRTRERNKIDKDRAARAPQPRSEDAFKAWHKKTAAKEDQLLFELYEQDDPIAVRAMCTEQWDLLEKRRERMLELVAIMQKKRKTNKLIGRLAAKMQKEASADVPLLLVRKHIRATNHRRRIQQRSRLFSVFPASSAVLQTTSIIKRGAKRERDEAPETKEAIAEEEDSRAKADAEARELQKNRNLCEPLPRNDYEVDENLFYLCRQCNEPVSAVEMIVEPSGAFDAYYFHPDCFFV